MIRTLLAIASFILCAAPAFGGYQELELAASASRTTTGNGSTVDSIADAGTTIFEGQRKDPVGHGSARFFLSVTTVSGTSPTLDVTVETLVGSVWFEIGAFTQATGTTEESIRIDDVPESIRAVWTIGGTTPDFTFSVHGVRVGGK